jgi:hypothetical protein
LPTVSTRCGYFCMIRVDHLLAKEGVGSLAPQKEFESRDAKAHRTRVKSNIAAASGCP